MSGLTPRPKEQGNCCLSVDMDHPHIQDAVHMARQRREATVHVVEGRQEGNAEGGSIIPEAESVQQSCRLLEQRVLAYNG